MDEDEFSPSVAYSSDVWFEVVGAEDGCHEIDWMELAGMSRKLGSGGAGVGVDR